MGNSVKITFVQKPLYTYMKLLVSDFEENPILEGESLFWKTHIYHFISIEWKHMKNVETALKHIEQHSRARQGKQGRARHGKAGQGSAHHCFTDVIMDVECTL